MIESRAVLLVTAVYGQAVCRDTPEASRDPLHRIGVKREEVVASLVLYLGAAIGHAARRAETRANLARVDRVVEYRRAEEEGRGAVAVVAGGCFGVRGAGKGGGGAEWDAIARRRRSRRGVGRRRYVFRVQVLCIVERLRSHRLLWMNAAGRPLNLL